MVDNTSTKPTATIIKPMPKIRRGMSGSASRNSAIRVNMIFSPPACVYTVYHGRGMMSRLIHAQILCVGYA